MSKVTLKVDGLRCEMSNGILSLVWKEDASLESLKKDGVELIAELSGTSKDSNAKRTFYVDYHAIAKFRKMHVSRLDVIEQTEDTVHISYVDTQGILYIEYHIILKAGESGFYSYVIGANQTDSELDLAEFRCVYRFGNRIFDHACTSERIGLQPTHKYMEQFECLQDETYRLPDGEKYTNGDVYSKYDYAGYFSNNPAWGHFGHGFGFFVIPVSTEYYPGGPMKQELLVHYDGIVLNYFTGSHFGTGSFHVPVGWKKFYGPFYLYINSGDDGEELYKDALKKAEEEKKKWPYSWVEHPLYPINRSEVTGTLTFSNGVPCTNTTVILCKSGRCIDQQSSDYIFYSTTDHKGKFSIPNVRFDDYLLYAYQTGGSIVEELSIPDIHINSSCTDLGNLSFPLSNKKLVWQLGKATRTCEGFKYAGELRNYKWLQKTPANLDFTIGVDKEQEDWYFAQVAPGRWNIHFTMDKVPTSTYHLTIALAGICKNNMTAKAEPYFPVYLNDTLIKEAVLINDSSVYRSATKNGRYRKISISIPSTLLKQGKNTISFINDSYMAMYDTVLFEQEV